MKTGSSTLSKEYRYRDRTVHGLLGTEIFIRIFSNNRSNEEMERDIDKAFLFFENFDRSFSRFRTASELSRLNRSEIHTASPTLFSLLDKSLRWHEVTEGLFDPSVLPDLHSSGYDRSWPFSDEGSPQPCAHESRYRPKFRDLKLDPVSHRVEKPLALQVDLGGIGKGFVVDEAITLLSSRYDAVIVDAGGDMGARGDDYLSSYHGFAIGIEDPRDPGRDLAYLRLLNQSVATSSGNRRQWNFSGRTHHHLIDPRIHASGESDILQATVIARTTEVADVWAKTLLLSGLEAAREFARKYDIAACFVLSDGSLALTPSFERYVWK